MTNPMTRPDDAASVKLLREALTKVAAKLGCATHDQISALRAEAEQALAATAPPKPYTLNGQWIDGPDCNGDKEQWNLWSMSDAQRSAVLDALNALAEKEASR